MPPFPSPEWAETAVTRLSEDSQFQRFCRAFDATVRFDFGEQAYAFRIDEGDVTLHEDPTFVSWDLALRAEEDVWRDMFSESPGPLRHDLLGAWLRGPLTMEGNLKTGVQHIRPLKRMFVVFRGVTNE